MKIIIQRRRFPMIKPEFFEGTPIKKAYGDMAGLSNSQLAILPATSHTGLFRHADWLLTMIPAFLNEPVY